MTQTDPQPLPTTDEGWEIYAERLHTIRLMVMGFQKDYGANVIRSLFLLNSGAAVATLTLIGALFGKDGRKAELVAAVLFTGARPALVVFGIGLVSAVLAATMGYLNFNALMDAGGTPDELLRVQRKGKPDDLPRWRWRVIRGTYFAAPMFCIVSGFAFIRGGMFISHAMKIATAAIIH